MPKIENLDGGKVRVEYETGEKFEGDPIEVLNKVGEAHVSTKRWAQNIKAENENLKASQYNPPPPPQPAPQGNADELALQNYLLEQQAKALGFKDGQEYKDRLQYVNHAADESENERIATRFMATCPEFPNTAEAIEKLAQTVEGLGWQFNEPNLEAAHHRCVRMGAYKPLTPEEINAQWAGQMQVASGTSPASGRPSAPPQPPQPGAPNAFDNQNPWAMSADEIRKKLLAGGTDLGKILMDMPPGGSL